MCMLEILSLLNSQESAKVYHSPSIKGCSTTAYSRSGNLCLAHNEDLFTYID